WSSHTAVPAAVRAARRSLTLTTWLTSLPPIRRVPALRASWHTATRGSPRRVEAVALHLRDLSYPPDVALLTAELRGAEGLGDVGIVVVLAEIVHVVPGRDDRLQDRRAQRHAGVVDRERDPHVASSRALAMASCSRSWSDSSPASSAAPRTPASEP